MAVSSAGASVTTDSASAVPASVTSASVASGAASAAGAAFLARERFGLAGASSASATAFAGTGGAAFVAAGLRLGFGDTVSTSTHRG